MSDNRLVYKNSSLGYIRFGTGSEPVICFHGYGEEAGMFSFLEKYAGNQYTFYALNLPFHGNTEWKEGLNFTPGDLLKIVELLTDGHSAAVPENKKRITLLGFSLGGRVALSLYQLIPGSVQKIVLLAPDGLKVNFWYWLSTQTWAGRNLFHFTMKNPGWFFGFLKLLNKLRLVNSSVFKFVKYYIDNSHMRQLLYDRWISLRKLRPHLPLIKKQVLENKTPVRLVYGKHDRIILPVVGERFRKGVEEHCTLTIIPSGHQVLHEKHAAEILKALNQ